MLMARGMRSSSYALLLWVRFAVHDPSLFSDQGKRWTANCASLFAYIHKERPDLTEMFLDEIARPGQGVWRLILLFRLFSLLWLLG